MPSCCIVLAPGAEEIETIAVADLLVRGGAEVLVASAVDLPVVRGSRGLPLCAHTSLASVAARPFDLVYLPGGKGSAEFCRDDAAVQDLAERQLRSGRLLAAICACPIALVPRGLCAGRRVTSYPASRVAVEPHAAAWLDQPVVVDGNLVTSQSAGTALHLGLSLVRLLAGEATARTVAQALVIPPAPPTP
ncbi:MAG: DJ-1/PfpI family protein [Planctomycetes bacterium]|nr:DJ-1/PfpI family protein [Planctomycetota bacterium]